MALLCLEILENAFGLLNLVKYIYICYQYFPNFFICIYFFHHMIYEFLALK